MVQGRRKEPLECICGVCEERFQTRRSSGAKYCGDKCRDRARYARDREKRLKAVQDYRRDNRDWINKRQREKRLENPEHYRKLSAKTYQKHREQRIEDSIKWQRANPDRVAVRRAKRRVREGGFKVTPKFQTRALGRSRGCCTYCGVKLDLVDRKAPNGLHWDHVVPMHRGGMNTEGNLVISCSRCNLGKGVKFLTEVKKTQRYIDWAIEDAGRYEQ